MHDGLSIPTLPKTRVNVCKLHKAPPEPVTEVSRRQVSHPTGLEREQLHLPPIAGLSFEAYHKALSFRLNPHTKISTDTVRAGSVVAPVMFENIVLQIVVPV
jgi:hypothetical protein